MKSVNTLTIVFTIIQLLGAVFLIAVVLLQSGKSAGLSGAISGGAETFFSKGKAKSMDAKLAKMTKWVALVFVLLTLVLNLL
ncbi:MAG: preprotein translocase subunit SecG [Oscillospiraceae bacterium]|nr:preprotein translocase subunit SecG [Oscillospiraceae bacterium]